MLQAETAPHVLAVKIHEVLGQKVTRPTQWNVTGVKGLVTYEKLGIKIKIKLGIEIISADDGILLAHFKCDEEQRKEAPQ